MDCPLELYSVCVRAHVSECDGCHYQSFDLYIGNFTQKIIPPKVNLALFINKLYVLFNMLSKKHTLNPDVLTYRLYQKRNLVRRT